MYQQAGIPLEEWLATSDDEKPVRGHQGPVSAQDFAYQGEDILDGYLMVYLVMLGITESTIQIASG